MKGRFWVVGSFHVRLRSLFVLVGDLLEGKAEPGHSVCVRLGAEGLTVGKRDSLLRIVEIRGITLAEEERDTISRCADVGRLDQWLKNALTASTATEVLA